MDYNAREQLCCDHAACVLTCMSRRSAKITRDALNFLNNEYYDETLEVHVKGCRCQCLLATRRAMSAE